MDCKKKISFWLILTFSFSYSQNLWQDRGEVFTDRKALPNGSVIHIVFSEGLVASYQATLNMFKSRSNPTLNNMPKEFNFLPALSGDMNKSETGDQSFDIVQAFEGRLAATITGFDPLSGMHRVSASQQMSINGKPQNIRITAQAFIGDIGTDREIASTRLADLSVRYQGFTVSKSVQESDFTNFSFSQTNVAADNEASLSGVELNEAKKKEYFLEFFKLILDQLF